MRRFLSCMTIAVLMLLVNACISTKPVVLKIDKLPEREARAALATPLLQNLRDFGNNMAALMLKDYRYQGIQETDSGAYLYRFDSTNPKLPKHAYIVFRLEGSPSLSTNVGDKNYIMLDGGSFGLVPADEPAVVRRNGFKLQFTKTGFREAFNPYCIGERGTYPLQLLLWFKNPATKDESMKNMTTLMLSAFPRITYTSK
jgi:hypothetical protein